jgi:hypothetical protein
MYKPFSSDSAYDFGLITIIHDFLHIILIKISALSVSSCRTSALTRLICFSGQSASRALARNFRRHSLQWVP